MMKKLRIWIVFSTLSLLVFAACRSMEIAQSSQAAPAASTEPAAKSQQSLENPKDLEPTFAARSQGDQGFRVKNTDILLTTSWAKPLSEKSSLEDRYNSRPSILIGQNNKWKQLELTGFERYGWQEPIYFSEQGEVWAFLDYTVEGRMQTVTVIHSSDFGKTWTVRSSIPKPQHTFAIKEFQLDANGTGFATLKDTEGEKAHAVTKDRGLNWTLTAPPRIKNSLKSAASKKSLYCLSPEKSEPQKCSVLDGGK